MYVDVGLIGVVVNLVDLFNFARECERNKFNYKVGDFRKIDFLGRIFKNEKTSQNSKSLIRLNNLLVFILYLFN